MCHSSAQGQLSLPLYVTFYTWVPRSKREELLSWHLSFNDMPIYNSPGVELGRLQRENCNCDSVEHL